MTDSAVQKWRKKTQLNPISCENNLSRKFAGGAGRYSGVKSCFGTCNISIKVDTIDRGDEVSLLPDELEIGHRMPSHCILGCYQ